MSDAGVHVVGARQHEDTRPVGGRALRQCRARHRAEIGAEGIERLITSPYRALRFLECETLKNIAQTAVELLWNEGGVAQRDQGRHMADTVLLEEVLLLEETRFGILRRRHDTWAGERGGYVTVKVRRQRVDHGREQHVDLVVPVAREEFAVVAVDALYRVAAVNGAASLAELARLILRAVGGELEPACVYAERTKKTDPELVR